MQAKSKDRLSAAGRRRTMREILQEAAMFERAQRVVQELQEGGLLAIRERGAILTCVEGILWITRDGERTDTVIAAGESFEIVRRGRVLVQALASSRVAIQRP